MKIKILLAALIAAGALYAAYRWWHRPAGLGDTDSVLVGEITNDSGEPDFDGSLREALRVALLQSPFLNLLSDEKIRTALRELGKPEDVVLTPELSASLCQNLSAQAYVTGTIA